MVRHRKEIGVGISLIRISVLAIYCWKRQKLMMVAKVPVLPAQAPTNINVTRIVLEKPGHWLKSTVLNPVVVMIDPT